MNPFTTIWGWLAGGMAASRRAPAVVDGVLQDRDWAQPPAATESDWSDPRVLSAHVRSAQLANVQEPARFFDARVEFAFPPTRAVWRNTLIGPTPVNPRDLSHADQAEKYRRRIEALAAARGKRLTLEVYEAALLGGAADYGEEIRRVYYLRRAADGAEYRDAVMVAHILLAYMAGVEESVDRRMDEVIEAFLR